MAKFAVTVEGKRYAVNAPDEQTAWDWANEAHETRKQDFAQRMAADQAEQRRAFTESEAQRPLQERIRANVGAGMHSLVQGVAGIPRLFGADVGPTSEDVAESRALKEQLAETMPGGKFVQIAGEIAPTLAIPAGAYGSLARAAGRALPRTIAARAADLGLTGAGVAAVTTPGDWTDRGLSAALAGAGSLAAPVLAAMGKGVYRAVRPTAAGRAAGREAAIAEGVARDLGPETTQDIVRKLEAPRTEFERAGVRQPTAAQLSRDPALQQMETGLRVQRPDLFKAIDEAASTGRWDTLAKIAQDEHALGQAMKVRKEATDAMRESALEAAGNVKGFAAPVAQAVDSILTGESRTIPQARTLANWVKNELAEGVTPAQLYSMRKSLTSGIPHGTELGSAMTQARAERTSLVAAIDDALEAASGGQWKPYLQSFQELSQPVTSMKAAQAIQKAFETTANRTAEGVPVITPHVLRKALAKHGTKQFGSKTIERLTPEERATMEAIARSAEAENAARMAQGTVGSATAGNIAAANRVAGQMMMRSAAAATGVPGAAVDIAANVVGGLAKRKREQALAELLRDPESLRRALVSAAGTMKVERQLGGAGALGARGLLPGAVLE